MPVDGETRGIQYADVDAVRDMLRANDANTVLELNSTGGGYFSAEELAALVIDFGLDTHVAQNCESSCVTVFLGGKARTMARGGRIGFHQLFWTDTAIEDYYAKNQERRGWDTPFEFAEWMYEGTQTETYNRLAFMVGRGVDPAFAIQTMRKPDTSMWYPARALLMAAGVLRP